MVLGGPSGGNLGASFPPFHRQDPSLSPATHFSKMMPLGCLGQMGRCPSTRQPQLIRATIV